MVPLLQLTSSLTSCGRQTLHWRMVCVVCRPDCASCQRLWRQRWALVRMTVIIGQFAASRNPELKRHSRQHLSLKH